MWLGAALSGIGIQMTVMTVGLQIFDLTRSTLMVGLVGGVALLPMLVVGPWGGMLADSHDRRTVLLAALGVAWLSTLGLLILGIMVAQAESHGDHPPLWPFYIFTTISSMAYIVAGAARKAVYPRVLSIENLPKANSLNGMSMGMQLTLGPALAGILVPLVGFPTTFAIDLVLAVAGFLGVATLPKIPPRAEGVLAGWRGIREGLQFLAASPVIRSSFLVDIIAMSLGRPYALLPAVAAVAIGGGPTTVGVLTASAAVGTFLTSIFSGPVAGVSRYGVAISRAVMVYGACTVLFGLVIFLAMSGVWGPVSDQWSEVNVVPLILGALCFMGLGASDEVSAIFRMTILMTAAPDEMRGRLQGVFFSVVAGGPRLGDLYVGILASTLALWAPSLIGGILIVVAIAGLLKVNIEFRLYRHGS
jgi:MFS family permease